MQRTQEENKIIIKGAVLNEEHIVAIIPSKERNGVNVTLISGGKEIEINIYEISVKDVFDVIEKKSSELYRLMAENEWLKKELTDTEDLMIRANTENEKLREQLGEEKPTGKWRTKECPAASSTPDGCAGVQILPGESEEDSRLHQDCEVCEEYAHFCDPAMDDEDGCLGRRRRDGVIYGRCQACIGLRSDK